MKLSATDERRAEDLVATMTMTEKIAQLRAVWVRHDPSGNFVPDERFRQRPDLREFLKDGIGQITRPFGTNPVSLKDGAAALNKAQKMLVEGTRLGIPALVHDECLAGFMTMEATQFPAALNLGATWDPELARRQASVIARQMRSVGSRQALGPVADVVRDARWGRVEECVAEDPYLVGAMVTGYVRGLQGDDWKTCVIATMKHFAGHSFGEGGRNHAPVHIGRRELADLFLIPFEMAIKGGGAQSVMTCYHDIDGEPGTGSRWLLTELLRDRWGFAGTVVSDYFAVAFLETRHGVAADRAEASARALHAGLDVELPTSEYFAEGLVEALDRGLIGVDEIDRSARRVLAQKFALGLFEKPYVEVDGAPYVVQGDRDLALEIAEKSLILLRNDGTLPLRPKARIALIGPSADDQMALFGNYNYPATMRWGWDHPIPKYGPTLREALEAELGSAYVSFTQGCRVLPKVERKIRADGMGPDLSMALVDMDRSGIPAAVAAAQAADVAVVAVGDRSGLFQTGTVGEGSDVDSLTLPGVQAELVEAVLATGKPTVLVLMSGRPYDLSAIAPRAAAIVAAWFPGEQGARAVAELLAGKINPSGKTTVTFPVSAGAQPLFYNHKILGAGFPPVPHFAPVFPFGHGLSYTRFDYADLQLGAAEWRIGQRLAVSCTIRNAGAMAGDEIVQLYITDPVAGIVRPVLELRGFRRVHLEPGEARRVSFDLHSDLLSFTAADFRRIVEPGEVILRIGASSADIRLEKSIRLTGAVAVMAEDRVLFTEAGDAPV